MIKKILLLFIIVFTISCDDNKNQLLVDLELKEGSGPCSYSLKILHPMDSTPEIKGVPSNFKNYVIRDIDLLPFQHAWEEYKSNEIDKKELQKVLDQFNRDTSNLASQSVDHNLLFIIGTTYNGRQAISYDSDNDENFEGEKILYFPKNVENKEKQRHILDTLSYQSAEFEYFNGNEIVNRTFTFKPIPFLTSNFHVSYEDSLENKFKLAITRYGHKKGFFRIGDKEYKIAVQLTPFPFLIDKWTKFIVTERKDTFPDFKTHPFYNVGDTINLNNQSITLSSFDFWGENATIEIIGPNKDSSGITKGYYIPNINTTTIDDEQFDLKDYKNKYVLLDFWGTWCTPCVKSIPELTELHSQFDNKEFVIISIAVDSDKEKVRKFIRKHDMNWIHLFEKRGSGRLTKKLNITGYPTTILLDKKGRIIERNENLKEIKYILENRIE